MSSDAVSELSKYRTLGMVNVWQGNMQNGEPTKLLGVPVITCPSMPKVESGRMPILYGDFSHFLIGDRVHRSIKRLNEMYAHQGQVGYVVSQRVDAVLLEKSAIAGLTVK